MIMDSSIALALILEPIIIISSFAFGIYKLIMFIKKKESTKEFDVYDCFILNFCLFYFVIITPYYRSQSLNYSEIYL